MIKAKFQFHYKGKVIKKDQTITTNEVEQRRLLNAGLAYEAFDKPTNSNTKNEIKEYLKTKNIEFSKDATKKELLEYVK